MLPNSVRLRKKQDFERVYKSGKTIRTALFRITVAPHPTKGLRIGMVVANKICSSAVERNRKKRQMRAATQQLLPLLTPGYDIIVSAQSAVRIAPYGTMKEDLRTGLQRAGVL